MMRPACTLMRRDSFSQEEMILHSECDFFEFQLADSWCSADADTDPHNLPQQSPIIIKKKLAKQAKEKAKKRQGRFKNVPYTFGRHFRNWLDNEVNNIKCPIVQKFMNKRKQNPRYHDSFKDFNDLFQLSGIGRQLGQMFFGQKMWIKYLLNNERVCDLGIYFQVERSYYEAALTGAKITEQKVRNI